MARPGYKSITIPDDLWNELNIFAKATFRSVPKVVEYLLKNCAEKEVS